MLCRTFPQIFKHSCFPISANASSVSPLNFTSFHALQGVWTSPPKIKVTLNHLKIYSIHVDLSTCLHILEICMQLDRVICSNQPFKNNAHLRFAAVVYARTPSLKKAHKVTTFQTLWMPDHVLAKDYTVYINKIWIHYVSTSPKGKPASCRGSCYLMNIWLWPFLLFDGLLVFETVLFCILRSMQSNPPVKLETHCTKFMLQIYGDKYN